jgi:hypothetical protein
MSTSLWKIRVHIPPPLASEAHRSSSLPGYVNHPRRGLTSNSEIVYTSIEAARAVLGVVDACLLLCYAGGA